VHSGTAWGCWDHRDRLYGPDVQEVEAVVREWWPELGRGVLDSAETPGGCWAHFSVVEMPGYRSLQPGQRIRLVAEAPGQDG